MEKRANLISGIIAFIIIAIIVIITDLISKNSAKLIQKENNIYNKQFRIISSSENKDLENVLKNYASQNNIDLEIEYAGTIDIMEKLNAGETYDAVWTSNSIWLYMLDSKVKLKNSKSTSINPVVFGIKKSKAQELGFIGKEVYTKDVLNAIQDGKLKFNMSSATQTNTGATAYLGFLNVLAGSPEILTEEDIENEEVKESVRNVFSGMTRTSGSEEFLEEMFLNGDYEAVIAYETSIININKKLEQQGKEPLYIIYAKDRSFYF